MEEQQIDPIDEGTTLDEPVQLRADLGEAAILVTDRRLLVVRRDRHALDVPLAEIRRIEFDIERSRPATLVIVSEQASFEPQVLAVHHDYYKEVAAALVLVGRRLAEPA